MQRNSTCLEDEAQTQACLARRTNMRAMPTQPGEQRGELSAQEPDPGDLSRLSTAELARRCADEQQHYHQRLPVDERAGLELFRRAIQQRDALAWEAIYQQWRSLLLRWLLQHPSASLALAYEPAESYVTAALSKFWQATTRAQPRQPHFATLAEVLAYLRRCLNSAVLDAIRQARARQIEALEEAAAALAVNPPPDMSARDFWEYIERALPERRERRLIYLRYVLGYQPREIVAAYPDEFPRVEKLYQMERLILRRLSRHPLLTRWKA